MFAFETDCVDDDPFKEFLDKSDAEEIKARFCLSKAAFKRAVGHLYHEHLITVADDGIRLTEEA